MLNEYESEKRSDEESEPKRSIISRLSSAGRLALIDMVNEDIECLGMESEFDLDPNKSVRVIPKKDEQALYMVAAGENSVEDMRRVMENEFRVKCRRIKSVELSEKDNTNKGDKNAGDTDTKSDNTDA